MDIRKVYWIYLLTLEILSSKIIAYKKPMIEKSTQVQMNSRELHIGESVANRFLRNGLIRVGRTADA